jgi:hypothetical protein
MQIEFVDTHPKASQACARAVVSPKVDVISSKENVTACENKRSRLVLLSCSLAGFLYRVVSSVQYTQATRESQHTSWSRYHPQIVMLPWFSSRHLRKLRTSVSQAGVSQELLVALLCHSPLSIG